MEDTTLTDFGYGPSDEYINSQAAQGRKTFDKVRTGRPQFGFPDISQDQVDKDRLLNVLLGASAGANAAGNAQHPLAALAMGLGGGISAPQAGDMRAQRQKVQMSLQEEQLNQAPVGAVAPQMVEALKAKYGMDVSEIPMGQFQKFAGLLTKADDMEKQLALIQARANANRDNSENRNLVDSAAAKNYEKTYRIPAQFFEGQNRRDVNAQLAGFKPYQKQAEALLQAQNQVNVLKAKWEEVKGDVGIMEGTARNMALGYGSKQNAKIAGYEAARNAAVTSIRKLFADSGAPSNFDVNRYVGAIPGVSTNPAKALENWDFLDQSNNSGKASLIQASPLVAHVFEPQGGGDEIRKQVQTEKGIRTGVWSATGKFLRYE